MKAQKIISNKAIVCQKKISSESKKSDMLSVNIVCSDR